MKWISMDTSTSLLALALNDDEFLIEESFEQAPLLQSERLVPALAGLLKRRGWDFAECGALALNLGPGSFTGLRVGLAFAKGAALGKGLKVLGVAGLMAWAEAAQIHLPGLDWTITVLLDARRDQVYRAQYSFTATGWRAVLEPALMPLEGALSEVRHPSLLTGDALDTQARAFEGHPSAGLWRLVPPGQRRVSPAAVARLAWPRLRRGEGDDPAALEPLYLRPSEAELKWRAKG